VADNTSTLQAADAGWRLHCGCYPGGAKDDFGIAYQDGAIRGTRSLARRGTCSFLPRQPAAHRRLGVAGGDDFGRMAREYTEARTKGKHPARAYVISDALEEIFVHH